MLPYATLNSRACNSFHGSDLYTFISLSTGYNWEVAIVGDKKIELKIWNMLLNVTISAGELPKGALYIGTSDKIKGGYKHTQEFVLVATKPADGGSNSESVNSRVSNSSITEDANTCAPAKVCIAIFYKLI